jgi:hypothetical protein
LAELGNDDTFERASERASSLLGIQVSESQVYRTCQNLAEELSEEDLSTPSDTLSNSQSDATQVMYGMVDGSMLFTDDGWQETKVGRVFSAKLIDREVFKWEMGESQYVAKRGYYSHFTAQFEKLLPPDSLCQKVFVTDGATWIGQWIKERYPNAVHILDYFHVCEKLSEAVPKDKDWLEQQKSDLLQSKIETVIERVKKLPNSVIVHKLLVYLQNHKAKMNYKYYREQGWMIGSGPIESAHRTVLQVRMKRSGIRWANKGGDNMTKLRIAYINNQRNIVRNALKKTA